MSYYQNKGYKVIAGGLLYPMESPFEKAKCHANHWFGNESSKFIVDGIDLSQIDNDTDQKISDFEKEFIVRIGGLIDS